MNAEGVATLDFIKDHQIIIDVEVITLHACARGKVISSLSVYQYKNGQIWRPRHCSHVTSVATVLVRHVQKVALLTTPSHAMRCFKCACSIKLSVGKDLLLCCLCAGYVLESSSSLSTYTCSLKNSCLDKYTYASAP